ncbi:LamG-like jellyroll fold domain-containing protein [Humibacter ginsenosidimutans]|uniref:LamG-like jellyroll fold domain-containing protein n=1 Tax=Humibacter ginsenosidimutans TaxID=2599293 RepID=A0A5B8M3J9_9MICO|nr:LamG-like jellyroll fold domain-containing protein [Humibacter ginsenosidimutans]QDZ14856.1 hypothetical protein FPZ11_08875 [Humibacter ginsenosidimutans]
MESSSPSPDARRGPFESFAVRLRFLMAGAIALVLIIAGISLGWAQSAAAATAYDPGDAVKPVASYTFDGDSGTTVVDSSGNGHNATWVNGVAGGGVTPSYTTGISGNAAHVSGNKNVIQLPLVAGTTDGSGSFSFEFWYFQNSTSSDAAVFASANTASCNNPGFSYYNTSASNSTLKACWGLTPGGTKEYLAATTGPTNGAWHYLAAVVDRGAGTVTTYEDGTAVDTSSSIGASSALAKYAFTLGSEGSLTDTGDGSVDALFDDVNFYDAPITASQIAADYAATKPATGASYNVVFDGNGATGGATATEKLTTGLAAGLTANGFTRAGYGFGGWATSPSGPIAFTDGQSVKDLTSTDGGTVTLYAVWNRMRAAGDTVAPIISYDFENDSGSTVVDDSGSGYNATWSGTPSYATGVSGKSAYVNSPDGSKQGVNHITLPLIAGRTDGSADFSYTFWLKEASSSSDSPIVSNQDFTHCYDKGTTLYNTSGSPGVLRACFGQNGTSTSQNYLPNVSTDSVIGSWHQLAVVVDRSAGTMTTYLDGQQSAKSTALTSAFTLTSGYPFRIGSDGSTTDTVDGFVNADIDDFDFYDQAISAAQVQNDYSATAPPPTVVVDGSSVQKGFVSDTFRAPQVRAGGTVAQPLKALFNGGAATFSKVSGDEWLDVSADGVVSGTAPSAAQQNPGTIQVKATDGTTTSTITVEVPVIGARDAAQLATTTWNLWDAGSHTSDATLKDLAVIAADGLDVIGVQSDGGQVATQLAAALGWYGYEGASGVGIVSAYPLSVADAVTGSDAAPATAVTAHVLGTDVRVWSVGLDGGAYGPDAVCSAGGTAFAAIDAEKATTRYAQAQAVVSELKDDVKHAGDVPVVVLGDLQSPSGADWTAATSSSHCDAGAVAWPVPALFASTGLKDSYRVAHADPVTDAGATWPLYGSTDSAASGARAAQAAGSDSQERVDYVDYAGAQLKVLGSNTLVAGWPSAKAVVTQAWTSDHRAVVTTFGLAASSDDGGSGGSTDTPGGTDGGGTTTPGAGGGTGATTPVPQPSGAANVPVAQDAASGLATTGSDVWLALLVGGVALLIGTGLVGARMLVRARRAD